MELKERQFSNQDRSPAYSLAFVLTALKTLPFFGLVSTLSNISKLKLLPCSANTCTFLSAGNWDGLHPNTILWGHNPFLVVQNGNSTLPADRYLMPLCPGNTSIAMKDLCQSFSARTGIVNTVHEGILMKVYMWCCFAWFTIRVLHDWSLIHGCPERITIHIGVLSLVVEVCGVASCFAWCTRATTVFLSPFHAEGCACYYILPDLESVLALSTPTVLLLLTIFKTEKIMRSAMFGDTLYFAKYDLPFYIAEQAMRQPMDIYIIDRTYGVEACERSPKDIRILCREDLVRVTNVFRWIVFPCNSIAHLLVCLTLTPITIRIFELLERTPDCQMHGLIAVVVVGLACLQVYPQLKLLVDTRTCTCRQKFLEKRPCNKLKSLARRFAYILVIGGSLAVLLLALHYSCFRRTCERSPRLTLAWSFSASVYVFVLVNMLYTWRTSDIWKTLKIKAGVSEASPKVYIELSEMYPEYGLHFEKTIAQDFMQEESASLMTSEVQRKNWARHRADTRMWFSEASQASREGTTHTSSAPSSPKYNALATVTSSPRVAPI